MEAGILYNAIFENEKTIVFHPELLEDFENRLTEYDPKQLDLQEIVKVVDVSDQAFRLCNDMKNERILCFRSDPPG